MAVIKNNQFLRRLGKKIKIYKEFIHDAQSFSKYYIESAEKQGKYKYSIMLLVHSLEKGMCMSDPRPFGAQKVLELMHILKTYSNDRKSEYEFQLAISILSAWKIFYEEHNWNNDKIYSEVCIFLKDEDIPVLIAGNQSYKNPCTGFDIDEFERVLLSRHSVRDFKEQPLKMEDVQFAIKCFIEAPTACNRQMCKVYYINNSEIKSLLDKTVIGIPGFNKSHTNFFVITYDLAAFAYSGERQQGLFNAGLCTMNFINGLHAKGIGSCCLQWSNKHSEDVLVRSKLKLADSERIGIVIGAGYYLEDNMIPCSVRKKYEDVFKIV